MPIEQESTMIESGDVRETHPTTAPPRLARVNALRQALSLMDRVPEPEGTDAAWEAVERGIREARHADAPGA